MTENNELLAELGLELDGAGAAVVEQETEEAKAARAPRVTVDVSNVTFGEAEDIPALVRNFGGHRATGSKYRFEEIAAPVAGADGAYKYAPMVLDVAENDADAFRRSIQSATTAANNKFKEGSDIRKFITRSFNDAEGKFAGMKVYRVDGTLED